ncbi:MAG: hypothetical protein K2Y37_15125 [Pirellulales bacterium]|nr:hypothetical protein [Pirellulales bacterium]
MILQVPISEGIEQRLRDEAAAVGQDLESFVVRLLVEHLEEPATGQLPPGLRTTADRLAFFEAIAARHPELPGPADYSRETIYADRGR